MERLLFYDQFLALFIKRKHRGTRIQVLPVFRMLHPHSQKQAEPRVVLSATYFAGTLLQLTKSVVGSCSAIVSHKVCEDSQQKVFAAYKKWLHTIITFG